MALIIENISGAQLAVNDLGFELVTGGQIDLTLESDSAVVAKSASGAGNDLFDLITAGSLVVKDPIGGANLSTADGIAACRAIYDSNWRHGAGARIGDNSDVTETAVADGEVLQYSAGQWVNVDPSTFAAAVKSHFSGHNNAITQTFNATPTTINFGTVIRSDADYSEAADVGGTAVTINTAGWYKIEYEVSTDGTTGTRSIMEAVVQVNGTALPGSTSYAYHRNTAAGEGTASGTIIANLAATDVVRVQGVVIAGNAVTTVAEGCRLNIQSIDGP